MLFKRTKNVLFYYSLLSCGVLLVDLSLGSCNLLATLPGTTFHQVHNHKVLMHIPEPFQPKKEVSFNRPINVKDIEN